MKKALNFIKFLIILFIPCYALPNVHNDIIEALISYNVLEDLNHDDINIVWENRSESFLKNCQDIEDIKLIENDKSKNSFTVSAKFKIGNHNFLNQNVTGFYTQYFHIPVLKINFFNGDVIDEDDLDIAKVNSNKIKKSTLKSKIDLIGKAAKKSMRAYKPIDASDLTEPNIINKGDKINVKYERDTLSISISAIALTNGSKGSVIKLKNLKSNNILSAIIKDKNNAELVD